MLQNPRLLIPGLGLPIPDAGSPPPADGTVLLTRGSFLVTATKSAMNMIKTMNRIALPVAVIGLILNSCRDTLRFEVATTPVRAA